MQQAPSGMQCCHLVVNFETNANGAIWWLNLQLIQVALSGGQTCNQCNWRHLVAKFETNANGAIWWPNLELMQMQVVEPGGQNWNQSLTCIFLSTEFAMLWGEIIQVIEAMPGSVVPLAMFKIFFKKTELLKKCYDKSVLPEMPVCDTLAQSCPRGWWRLTFKEIARAMKLFDVAWKVWGLNC